MAIELENEITFGSLFAGIGGFDLGFERAGLKCKWQVEIDDYATKVLEKNWPEVHRERDIKTCGKHNLEYVDIICGGFPCQDISYAGRGAGLAGKRSGLFFEAIRVVRELEPRVVVLENVAALLTRGLDTVLGTLASLGYDAEWHCIPASYVGAPHRRDRIWIMAYTNDTRSRTSRYGCKKGAKAIKRREINPLDKPSGFSKDVSNTDSNRSPAGFPEQKQREKGNAEKPNDNYSGSTLQTGWWDIEPAMGELVDGVSGGLVRFAGRIATEIPNRTHKLRCLGNALVPQVAELIALRTIEILQEQSGISVKP